MPRGLTSGQQYYLNVVERLSAQVANDRTKRGLSVPDFLTTPVLPSGGANIDEHLRAAGRSLVGDPVGGLGVTESTEFTDSTDSTDSDSADSDSG